jgi:HEAT repeat protein
MTSVATTLRDLPQGATPTDVWKSAAHALLRIDSSEADALGAVFEDPATTDERRQLVLDLLAGAGTVEAQVVIRRLLSLSIARRNCRVFASFVQRLGLVEIPDGPTLRYLMTVYGESRSLPVDVRASCAYALGAAAGHAFVAGEREAAVRSSDVLRHSLPDAATPEERAGLLTALGNAGLPTDGPTILRHATDPDPRVRAAAALALRKIVSPQAREALHTLVSDADPKVAGSALVALSEHPLSNDDLESVALLILAGKTARALDGRLLRLLAPPDAHRKRSVALEAALRLLLARQVQPKNPSGEYLRVAPQVDPKGAPRFAPAPAPHAVMSALPGSDSSVSRATARTEESELIAARVRAAAEQAAAAQAAQDDAPTRVATAPVAQPLEARRSVPPPPHGSGAYRMVNPPRALTGTAFMPAGLGWKVSQK